MNTANVIPLSAPRRVSYATSTSRAAVPNPVCVRFGAFELDEANARLSRDGTAITLAPRPFGLLCALARRPGSLLTKNTLLDDVWGHQFVSESVLKTAISDLRSVLDDDPKDPRFIETVSRRGYRFIAPTTAVSGSAPISVVPKLGPCKRDAGCALPEPVFATIEEVCYSQQLRMRLRALLLGDAAPAGEPCSAGAC